MSSEPQPTPEPSEPHPLDTVRQQAEQLTLSQARSQLDTLSEQQAVLSAESNWSAAAEEIFRQVIGMERKAQLEMRVALGDAGAAYIRRTEPLAEMPLGELQAEYRAGRKVTLALLDHLIATPAATAWTMGEQVEAHIYSVALLSRLTKLGNALAEGKA